MIRLTNLTKRFTDDAAVDDVSLEIPDGAFLVLLGPSGCGKSTTLRMIAGLETPTAGSITLGDSEVSREGRDVVPPGKRDLGLVFQSYALWPHMTVKRNVEWPLRVAGWSRADRDQRIDDVLSLLSISELRDRYPSELSGGQQQRVAIARTLGPKPSLLLLDEPLSNLDAKLRAEMRVELQRLHQELGTTTVYVTHDQTEAMALATHVAVMNGGRLEQLGSPVQLLRRPASPFVARFIGSPPANVVPAAVDDTGLVRCEDAELTLDQDFTAGTRVTLAFDPSDCSLVSGTRADGLSVQVLEHAPVAGKVVATVETLAGRRLTSIIPADDLAIHTGDRMTLVFDRAPIAIFPDHEQART